MAGRDAEPGIEVVPVESEAVPTNNLSVFYDRSNGEHAVISDVVERALPPQPQDQKRRLRIWRRQTTTFWLTIALSVSVVIVVIIAVVAGISISRNNKEKVK